MRIRLKDSLKTGKEKRMKRTAVDFTGDWNPKERKKADKNSWSDVAQ